MVAAQVLGNDATVGFAGSQVNYELVVWLNESASRRNSAVKAAYLWELDTALKAHGIEIPFPQQDLRIRSLFGLEGAAALAALRADAGLIGGTSPAKIIAPPGSLRQACMIASPLGGAAPPAQPVASSPGPAGMSA